MTAPEIFVILSMKNIKYVTYLVEYFNLSGDYDRM